MAGQPQSNSSFVFGELKEGPKNFVAARRLRSNSFFVDKELAENIGVERFENELREKFMKINRNRRLSLEYSPKKNGKKSSKRGFEFKLKNLKNVSIYCFSFMK